MPGAYDAVVHHALGVVSAPLARAAYGINPIGGFTQVYSEAASGSGGVGSGGSGLHWSRAMGPLANKSISFGGAFVLPESEPTRFMDVSASQAALPAADATAPRSKAKLPRLKDEPRAAKPPRPSGPRLPGIDELADFPGLPDQPGLPALPLEADRLRRLAQLKARKAALVSLDAQTTAALAQMPKGKKGGGARRHKQGDGELRGIVASSEAGAATSGAPPRKSLPLAPPGPWRHHFFRNMSDSAGAELTAALMPRNEPRQWLLTPKAEWKRPNEHIVLKPIVPTHRYQR